MRKVLYVLGELEDSDLQWLLDAGRSRFTGPGEAIIREGQRLDELFIVLTGELAVRVGTGGATGGGTEVARLGPGEMIGDMSLLDSRPPNATVTTLGDARLYAISQDKLRAKLASDTAFAARFYRAICIFLANRLNRTTTLIGTGRTPSLDAEVREDDEISPDALDKIDLAGARFDWFRQHLGSR
jgi:CRP-like cAMP-binding protein